MAETKECQLVVLGAGPGGYAAAFLAADKGLKVTLIDAAERPGGTCLFVGCIPSKALLHTAKLITDTRDAAGLGLQFAPPKIDVNGVRNHWQKVVDTMSKNLAFLCKARKVEYVKGRGKFLDAQTIQVDDGPTYRFQHCIVATGSTPTRPPAFFGKGIPRVMDSSGALKLEDVPPRLLVVGGGYIGLEMGYVYAALGSKVTVVELLEGLLPGVDRDLVLPLHKRLETLFEKIYLRTKVAKLEEAPNGIKAFLEGPEVTDREPVFERVLVAIGRKPNTGDIGLDKAGVEVDDKGFIKVNEQRRTTSERIFAIGDVAGEPMLAHKATYEGKIAAEVIAGEKAVYDCRAVPAVVFTDPEVAWCGLTETEAKKQKREVKKVKFNWVASGRAMTLARTEGVTKLLVDPETERVLGVGIVGVDAGDLIAEAMLAIEMSATAKDLALTMHAHPTLSETIFEAAEDYYGIATHKAPTKKS
jgi:dihydrolipoamide dehydrogenase